MKSLRHIVILLLCMWTLSVHAQDNEPTSAAGYDFYFTLFDHWGWNGNSEEQSTKYCGFSICAVEGGDMTLSVPSSTGDKHYHFDQYNNLAGSLRNANDAILQGVHFHSTGACYLHVWAHGQNAGDETMILPKHLLGTQYMVQGVPGTLYHQEQSSIPTYSQFTVVGTENYTNVVITPKVDLRCVNRNNALIPAGRQTGLFIQENEVLLFQPEDYTKDVSGTLVESDKVVAVFQGNTKTNIGSIVGDDFVWEQARPTDSWGKEFIVAKSTRTPNALCRLTALYDNTEVYYYLSDGNKYLLTNLSAGESVKGTSMLPIEHFEANQPICCYLYTQSRETNDNIGDPSMTEITPVDNMATEARWMLEQVDDNTPWKFSLIVTMRAEDEQKVKYNNYPLSTYLTGENGIRMEKDGFVSYELYTLAYVTGKLTAEEGAGFSAYILRIGNISEASSFSISMPFTVPPPDFCPDGALLFREDFGGNNPSDPIVSHTPVSGMSSQYRQIYDTATCKGNDSGCVGMSAGRYLVAKRGYRNSTIPTYSVWHVMDDHTSFGDTTTGYFLEIDGRESGNDVFYSTTLDGLCPGLELSFSAYIANVTTAGQYNAWRNETYRGYVHPKLTFRITDPYLGTEIAKYNTDTISHDWSLFGVPNAWKQTAHWQQIGMKFTVPEGVSKVCLSILNNASGSTGNDFALDDIEVRLCMPPVSIESPDTVCWGKTAQLIAVQEYPYMVYEPLYYRWEYSSDSIAWTMVQNSTSETLTINRFKETHAGWYRVSMGTEDRVGSENCRSNSEPVYLAVQLCMPPVTIEGPDTVCMDTKNSFTTLFENQLMQEPLQYFWEFSSDSISWSPAQEGDAQQLKLKAKPRHTGWYRVTVFENGSTPDAYCHVTSEPFRLFVIDDCPPILCPEGKLLDTPNGLCAGMDLSFIVNLTPAHNPTRLLIRITDADFGNELRLYDTGEVPSDSIQVGTSLTVPEATDGIRWTITDNSGSSGSEPLPIESVELRLCIEPISIEADTPACRKYPITFLANYENYGILLDPQFQWIFSADSVAWETLQTGPAKTYSIDTIHRSHEGWYVVRVADRGNIGMPNCRMESEPFLFSTRNCQTAVYQYIDTTACDTLLPIHWRTHTWQNIGSCIDTLRDIDLDDSVYVHLSLDTVTCCPNIAYFRVDSAICDTLLPFIWFFRDTMVLFTDIGSNEIEYIHPKWEKCIGEIHTLTLDTFHCERLYPIIVNKYNWQLLLDHVSLRRFFPGHQPLSYQWYCDSVAIPGATGDDYSEFNELHGQYQLFVQLDGDEHAWSNILDIRPDAPQQPVTKRIYNAQGCMVSEDQLGNGIFLIVYQQGDKIWTEKKYFNKNY